jgi:TetR/AcrR family transcriptional repressor of mexJK operon
MKTFSQSKRQAILDAARLVFINHGYSGSSMEAIAEAAPVSKPTLYNHFKSKQDLFAAVFAERCQTLLETLAQVKSEQLEPKIGLKNIAAAFVKLLYSEESLKLYRLIVAEQQHFPELGALIYRSGPEQTLQRLAAYLSELNAAQTLKVPDVDSSSRLLLGMLKGVEHFRCTLGLQPGLTEAEQETLINSAVSLFLKGHGYET